MPETFRDWLRRQQHRGDAIGDLARAGLADAGWRASGPASLLDRLDAHGSSPAAYAALREARVAWLRER